MGRRWTAIENDLLTEFYSSKGVKWVSGQLVERSEMAIMKRAEILGLSSRTHSVYRRARRTAQACALVDPDDTPHKTVDYGGISITWTVGEWRRLCNVRAARADNMGIEEGV